MMRRYLFSASNLSPIHFSQSFEALFEVCENNIFDVVLPNSDFIKLLYLLSFENVSKFSLNSSQDFESIYDLSNAKFPELSHEEFNIFYENWLKNTGRESTMDEYGQLIFIQGQATLWNLKDYRFILVEKL